MRGHDDSILPMPGRAVTAPFLVTLAAARATVNRPAYALRSPTAVLACPRVGPLRGIMQVIEAQGARCWSLAITSTAR